LAYAITAKPDSSLYPDPYSFCDFFIPFPTGDDRYFISTPGQLSLPFLHYRMDCFSAVTYLPAAAKESGFSIWSSSILSISPRALLQES
jgi:hypothetical protein